MVRETETTNTDILKVINKFSTNVDKRFSDIDQRFDGVDNRLGIIEKEVGKIPFWVTAHQLHELVKERSKLEAYGFNYDIEVETAGDGAATQPATGIVARGRRRSTRTAGVTRRASDADAWGNTRHRLARERARGRRRDADVSRSTS